MPTPPSKPLLTTRAARHALLTPTPAHRRQIPPDSDATHGTALDKEEYRGETHVSLRGAPSAHPPAAPGVRRAPAGPPRSAGRGASAGVACTTAAPPQRSRGARGDRFPLPPIPPEGAQRGGRGAARPSQRGARRAAPARKWRRTSSLRESSSRSSSATLKRGAGGSGQGNPSGSASAPAGPSSGAASMAGLRLAAG